MQVPSGEGVLLSEWTNRAVTVGDESSLVPHEENKRAGVLSERAGLFKFCFSLA